MNRDQAVAEIKQALGFRKSLDDIAVTALINSQQEMEKLPLLPWFLESEMSSVSTTAPTVDPATGLLVYEERVPLPADFLREKEDNYLKIKRPFDFDFRDMEKRDYDYIRKRQYHGRGHHHHHHHGRVGVPDMYSISAKYFRLRPFPDAAYPLEFIYYKRDTTLQSNIENLWLFHYPYLLIGRSISRIASGGTRDDAANAVGQSMQQDALQSMIQETEWREHTNRRYAMGEDI